MAKKVVRRPPVKPRIKNANLIGKGGKQIVPVDGSFKKGYQKVHKPKTPVKAATKATPVKVSPRIKKAMAKPPVSKPVVKAKTKSTPTKGR